MATKTKKSSKKFSISNLIPKSKKLQALSLAFIFGIVGTSFVMLTSAQTAGTNAFNPTGVVDTNSCTVIGGWTVDGDSKATSTEVHIYIDGTGFNTGKTSVARPDVNSAVGVTGTHGFYWSVPANYRDGKAHKADVYAINIDSNGGYGGTNVMIGTGTWTCGTPSPQAAVTNKKVPEGVVDVNNCSVIGGWTIDPDSIASSTEVHIYIDNIGHNLGKTSVARPDVNSAKNVTGTHGFYWSVPAAFRDGKAHIADVYAINIDSNGKYGGENIRIGTKSWACGAAANAIEVGTCVAQNFATSACTKEQAQSNKQTFVGVNEMASCVAIDGTTMIRCSQEEHDKQVAAGVLIEKGCLGKTLDGTNRVDCSASSKATLDHFFQGLDAQKAATVNRTRTTAPAPGSSGGAGSSATPAIPPIDFAAIAAVGAANLYYSPYTPTVADCTVWYQKKVYDVVAFVTVGSHMEYKNYGTIRATKDQCRNEFNKPNRARSHYQWNGSNYTN